MGWRSGRREHVNVSSEWRKSLWAFDCVQCISSPSRAPTRRLWFFFVCLGATPSYRTATLGWGSHTISSWTIVAISGFGASEPGDRPRRCTKRAKLNREARPMPQGQVPKFSWRPDRKLWKWSIRGAWADSPSCTVTLVQVRDEVTSQVPWDVLVWWVMDLLV